MANYVTLSGNVSSFFPNQVVNGVAQFVPSNFAISSNTTFAPGGMSTPISNGSWTIDLMATDGNVPFYWTATFKTSGASSYQTNNAVTFSFYLPYGTGAPQEFESLTFLSTPQPVEPGGAPVDYSGTITSIATPIAQTAAEAAEEAAQASSFQLSSSYSLGNLNYEELFNWSVTGTTDSTGPFGAVAGSQTYGGVVGPAFWFGYNHDHLSGKVSSSGNGAAGISCFADAGDTNASGAHGIEFNPACFVTADGTGATNAFEMVAVNDNTNTVNTTIRCGTGTSSPYTSAIYFQNASASTTFLVMSNATGQSNFQAPVTFSGGIAGPLSVSMSTAQASSLTSTGSTSAFSVIAQGTTAAATFSVLSASGSSSFIISGNNANTINASMYFQKAGVNKWGLQYEDPYLLINNYVNAGGGAHAYFIAGATYPTAATWFLSQLQCYDSMIVGYQTLATTATSGFLYIPSCAGPPTGVPASQTGTKALVYDSTNNNLYVYNGGWKKTTTFS